MTVMYIDINAISLCFDFIFQQGVCLFSKLRLEVEHAKSNLTRKKKINRPVPTDSNSRAYLGRDSERDPNKRDYFYFYVWGQKSRDY